MYLSEQLTLFKVEALQSRAQQAQRVQAGAVCQAEALQGGVAQLAQAQALAPL